MGEPDFVTPWRIREAAIYSLERGYTQYTSNWGLLELRPMGLSLEEIFLRLTTSDEEHVVREPEVVTA